uniref:Pentatricopeptide repeat-containing protein-mitochondrial domain-containing protein n=2 Tax=Hemiselmis andersenii TaxID=464988 RepID=A0A6U4L7U1_HEMAN|mmetsp:Transcript_9505/g.23318  ORF Transcript_9505/g.23318 Transcript_9505/m.23318 type:complete len:719 (+) Transcript_9505:215-2371(+)
MTSFRVPINKKASEAILSDYLSSKQMQQAFNVLESMPPQLLYFARFLHACVENMEMEMAEKACELMETKGIEKTEHIYNMMIRGYGKKGHLEDAINEMDRMEENGLTADQATYNSLLDASISSNNLEHSMRVLRNMQQQRLRINLLHMRRLIRGLCLQRNIADAFEVFDVGVANGVDGDLAVCSDLIDVSKECHMPERVPKVFACMQRRGLKLDYLRSHTLISLLSQVDELKSALTVLDLLPASAQRCHIGTYTQLVGSCFRANLGDEAMRLIKEYLGYAPADQGLTLQFFNYCMKGFRQLKSPAQCAEMQDIMEERGVEPDYETFKEVICCCLEVRMYKQALHNFKLMNAAGFEAEEELANAYICGLAPSKVLNMHNLCWAMFVSEREKGTNLPIETLEAVFDSCVTHARISRVVEVGVDIEVLQGPQAPMKAKRIEHLRRARSVLNIQTGPAPVVANNRSSSRTGGAAVGSRAAPSRKKSLAGSRKGSISASLGTAGRGAAASTPSSGYSLQSQGLHSESPSNATWRTSSVPGGAGRVGQGVHQPSHAAEGWSSDESDDGASHPSIVSSPQQISRTQSNKSPLARSLELASPNHGTLLSAASSAASVNAGRVASPLVAPRSPIPIPSLTMGPTAASSSVPQKEGPKSILSRNTSSALQDTMSAKRLDLIGGAAPSNSVAFGGSGAGEQVQGDDILLKPAPTIRKQKSIRFASGMAD